MTVDEDLVQVRFSVKTGAAGDTTASDGASSLGKYISTTLITSGSLHNLFDVVSGTDNAASDVEYRCFFLVNLNVDTWSTVKVWVVSEVAGGCDIKIGVDPTAVSLKGVSPAQAVEIADEDTLPAGVTFVDTAVDEGSSLAVGTLDQDEVRAIWLERTATNSSLVASDGVTLRFSGTG